MIVVFLDSLDECLIRRDPDKVPQALLKKTSFVSKSCKILISCRLEAVALTQPGIIEDSEVPSSIWHVLPFNKADVNIYVDMVAKTQQHVRSSANVLMQHLERLDPSEELRSLPVRH